MKLSLRWKIIAWGFLNLVLIAAGMLYFLRAQFQVGIESLLAGPTGARLDAIALPLSTELRTLSESDWGAALERATGEWRARGVKAALFRNDGRFVMGDFRELPAEVKSLLDAHDSKMRGGGPPRGPGERRSFERGNSPRGEPARRDMPERPPGNAGAKSNEITYVQLPVEAAPRERPQRREPPDDGPGRGPGGPGGPPPDWDRGGEPPGARGDGSRVATTGPNRLEKFMLVTDAPRLYWAGVHLDSVAGRFPATLFLASDSLRGGGLFFDYVPWLWLGGAILLGSALLWLPLVHRLTRSLARLTGSAEKIAEGNFEPPPETRRQDEIGRLHNAHRHMAQRLEGYVAGQRRFLGDTAHELLSPLARLEVALSILEQRAPDADRAYTERALGEVRHISALVHELLAFSKSALSAGDKKLEAVALAGAAREAAQREAGDTQMTIAIPEDVCVRATPALLSRAFGNVIRNAVRYAGPPIRISSEIRDDRVIVTISDEGPGVPPDALPRIFDPFFRPDTSRTSDTGGTGLGLAIVKGCIEACGGSVTARNRSPRGFEIEMQLIAAQAER